MEESVTLWRDQWFANWFSSPHKAEHFRKLDYLVPFFFKRWPPISEAWRRGNVNGLFRRWPFRTIAERKVMSKDMTVGRDASKVGRG